MIFIFIAFLVLDMVHNPDLADNNNREALELNSRVAKVVVNHHSVIKLVLDLHSDPEVKAQVLDLADREVWRKQVLIIKMHFWFYELKIRYRFKWTENVSNWTFIRI